MKLTPQKINWIRNYLWQPKIYLNVPQIAHVSLQNFYIPDSFESVVVFPAPLFLKIQNILLFELRKSVTVLQP